MKGKHKGNIEIGYRMSEELIRIFGTRANVIRQFPCGKNAFDYWQGGGTPGGYMLERLHYHGGDVLYVLTGKRSKKNGKKPV